jgi:hypothetical protein
VASAKRKFFGFLEIFSMASDHDEKAEGSNRKPLLDDNGEQIEICGFPCFVAEKSDWGCVQNLSFGDFNEYIETKPIE